MTKFFRVESIKTMKKTSKVVGSYLCFNMMEVAVLVAKIEQAGLTATVKPE